MRARTIDQALERVGGGFPGLAVLRLAAIGALIFVHALLVSTSYPLLTKRVICAIGPVAIAVLFAALGLTIADACARKPTRRFVVDWLRRSAPPYALAILGAAFVVGPLTSVNGARSYVTDPELWRYVANLAAVPQFTLPGVFGFNDLPGVVNGVVWIAPVHLALVIIAAGVQRLPQRWRVAVLVGVGLSVGAGMIVTGFADSGPTSAFTIAYLFDRGDALGGFLAGIGAIAVFESRRKLVIGTRAVRGAMLALAVLVLLGNGRWVDTALFRTLVVPPTLCLVVHYALRPLRLELVAERLRPFAAGLLWFSFPVQQLAVALGPRGQNALVNLALSLPVVAVLAFGTTYLTRFVLAPDQRRRVSVATMAPSAVPRRRRRIGARFAGAGNFLLVAALFLVVVLGTMAMLYLALQRDAGGV